MPLMQLSGRRRYGLLCSLLDNGLGLTRRDERVMAVHGLVHQSLPV